MPNRLLSTVQRLSSGCLLACLLLWPCYGRKAEPEPARPPTDDYAQVSPAEAAGLVGRSIQDLCEHEREVPAAPAGLFYRELLNVLRQHNPEEAERLRQTRVLQQELAAGEAAQAGAALHSAVAAVKNPRTAAQGDHRVRVVRQDLRQHLVGERRLSLARRVGDEDINAPASDVGVLFRNYFTGARQHSLLGRRRPFARHPLHVAGNDVGMNGPGRRVLAQGLG